MRTRPPLRSRARILVSALVGTVALVIASAAPSMAAVSHIMPHI